MQKYKGFPDILSDILFKDSEDPESCPQNLTKLPEKVDNSGVNSWGFSMRGIRPKGDCPKCEGSFKWNEKRGYICPDCLTHPERFLIDFHYKGERIRRGTTLDGKTLRSFADAHGLLRQAQNEIDAHRFDPTRWKTKEKREFQFSYLIDRWYKEKVDLMKKGKRAPSYVPKLHTYMKHYYLPYFGNTDVREIFGVQVKDFARQLPNRLSLKYQKNILDSLRHFFRWLDEEKLIDDIPTFPKIEVPEHDFKVLSPESQELILDHIPLKHKPIFVFLFNQGCRPSEARALKWKDIEGDIVTYRRTWSGRTLRETTKTKRIRNNLLFPETLTSLPTRRFPEQFVFTHGKGRPYSPDFLNKLFRTATGELGIQITLYEATKHSFGTRYVNDGISRDLLKEWFGHTKIEMTERYSRIKVVDAFRQMLERTNKLKNFTSTND
jgi:integrase